MLCTAKLKTKFSCHSWDTQVMAKLGKMCLCFCVPISYDESWKQDEMSKLIGKHDWKTRVQNLIETCSSFSFIIILVADKLAYFQNTSSPKWDSGQPACLPGRLPVGGRVEGQVQLVRAVHEWGEATPSARGQNAHGALPPLRRHLEPLRRRCPRPVLLRRTKQYLRECSTILAK